jgi:hypothetical protein
MCSLRFAHSRAPGSRIGRVANVCFRPIADIDAALYISEAVGMYSPYLGCRLFLYRPLWTAVTLAGLSVSSSLAAETPLPSPVKLAEDLDFTCQMLSERAPPTTLLIHLRYQPETYKNSLFALSYWWTISGDDLRYPSRNTFMNMRSMETEFQPTSRLSFVAADGWRYSYSLYYGVEERFPSFYYIPDHLIVRRWKDLETKPAAQLVGVGECHLNSPRRVQ